MHEKLKKNYNKLKLANKQKYLMVSSARFKTLDEFLNTLADAIKCGNCAVILTERNNKADAIMHIASQTRDLCNQFDTTFIIAERADIAFLIDADGVYLECGDLDVKSVRKLVGENAIIGASENYFEYYKDNIELLKQIDFVNTSKAKELKNPGAKENYFIAFQRL